jgi:hypothetical protein
MNFPLIPAEAGTQIMGRDISDHSQIARLDLGPGLRRDERSWESSNA